MRRTLPVLRRLSAGILALAVLLLAAAPVLADTGTFKILDYAVTMEPQNDGQVLITVQQSWQVLTGNAPWVTVGLPNRYFEIQNSGGDVSGISDGSGSGFYGVRLDLDRTYQAGQTFDIRFTVLQNNLLERLPDENIWRIDYTPGWYDSIPISHLQVNLVSPVAFDTYTGLSPSPLVDGNTLTWESVNLKAGERLKISMSSYDGTFLTEEPPTTGGSGPSVMFWVVLAVIIVAGLLIFMGVRQNRKARDAAIQFRVKMLEKEMEKDPEKQKEIDEKFKEYVEKQDLKADAQGRYYDASHGVYLTPMVWWAIVLNQQINNSRSSSVIPPSSSSNNTPGCVSCACVSCACACACACAGGGAAGCSRKTLHEFRRSRRKNAAEKDNKNKAASNRE